jgi:CBS domain-containing protein
VISERDVVRAVAGGRDVESTRAIDACTTSVVWCHVTATIAEVAAEMMEHYVRHILVEDLGRLAGVVSGPRRAGGLCLVGRRLRVLTVP